MVDRKFSRQKEHGEGREKHRLVVGEQSWACGAQHRECRRQYCDNYVCCQVGTGNARVGGHPVKCMIV